MTASRLETTTFITDKSLKSVQSFLKLKSSIANQGLERIRSFYFVEYWNCRLYFCSFGTIVH